MAKVESARGLIEAMGSICTATLSDTLGSKFCQTHGVIPAQAGTSVAFVRGAKNRGPRLRGDDLAEGTGSHPRRVESTLQMARPRERRKENHVEAGFAGHRLRMTAEPELRRPHDPPPVHGGERLILLVREAARFHLDEHGEPAAPGDQVDLADRRLHPLRHDAEAVELQEQAGPPFAAAPRALGEFAELDGRPSPAP